VGRIVNGVNVEFSESEKAAAFQRNYDNPPRGCVGFWCEWCYFSSMHRHYFQVDHIIPVAKMQQYGISVAALTGLANACILCTACNASKGAHGYPRKGTGLAYRAPNANMTWGEKRAEPLDWDELVLMAGRRGIFRQRG
jgi:5-methylcytosine-specific restriction endonuclease McrA